MIIDYYILHYNRPYFAEAHLLLAKKYFPFVRNFILLDDGSRPEALKLLREKFDIVLSSNTNVNNWKNGTVGDLIQNAFAGSSADMVMFSEDDFFPCPYYVDDSNAENDFISPDVLFKNDAFVHGLNDSCIDIINRKNAIMSMARSNYGWKAYRVKKELESLLEVDTSIIKRTYSNWPWMMSSALAKKIFIGLNDTSIWQIESKVDINLKSLKEEKVKLYVPRTKNFIHVGFLCSTRKEDFNNIGKFNGNRKKAIMHFSNNSNSVNLDQLRENLLNRYIDGRRIDVNILYSAGLHKCLKDFAFS